VCTDCIPSLKFRVVCGEDNQDELTYIWFELNSLMLETVVWLTDSEYIESDVTRAYAGTGRLFKNDFSWAYLW